jgi:hypothetical protein
VRNAYEQKLNYEWDKIKINAINKIESYLTSGDKEVVFTKKEYMQLYTTIYNLSTAPIEAF